jgi:hypothetical protein
MDDNNPTPEEGQPTAKARRSRKPAKAETTAAPQVPSESSQSAPPPDGNEREWVKTYDPGTNFLIGNNRRIRFSRNQFQQALITFTAPEGDDPKPDVKYTQWLRTHGWDFDKRPENKYWWKQLPRNSEEAPFARAQADRAAEQEFLELANLIRQDNGLTQLEPVQQRTAASR